MSLTKLSMAGNNLVFPARESGLVSNIPAMGRGKSVTFFYSVCAMCWPLPPVFPLVSLLKTALAMHSYLQL